MLIQPKIKSVIFDLDGTLIDSVYTISEVLNEMRQELGMPQLGIEHYRNWISLGADRLILNSMDISVTRVSYFLDVFRKRYAQKNTTLKHLYPEVLEALRRLRASNIQLAICSNKPYQLCLKILTDLGIEGYFTSIVGGGVDFKSKPSPDGLYKCLEELRVDPRNAVFVGDSSVDQLAAYNAGLTFIFFSGGYDDGVIKQDLKYEISSMLKLLPLVQIHASGAS